MKKTLVALATLAVAGGAFAQTPTARAIDASGVTIFGVADATYVNRSTTAQGSLSNMDGSGRNESTRLGFRGVEDIGGGWGAAFWLEAAYNQDDGSGSATTAHNQINGLYGSLNGTSNAARAPIITSLGPTQGLTFNRAATVSLLNKNLGEIRVGRDYAPAFWNLTVFDPFGTVGVGSQINLKYGTLGKNSAVTPPGNSSPQVRASNAIGWLSNDMSGLRFQIQYAMSEQQSGCTAMGAGATYDSSVFCSGAAGDGKSIGWRASYASGPFAAAVSQQITNYANAAAAPILQNPGATAVVQQYSGNMTDFSIAGSYDFGVAKVMANVGSITYGPQSLAYDNRAQLTASSVGVFTAATNATNVGTLAVSEWKVNHSMIGAVIPVGNIDYKVSYGQAKKAGGLTTATMTSGTYTNGDIADGATQKQIALGAVYNLSKRTAVYGTYSNLSASGTNATAGMGVTDLKISAANSKSEVTGIDLGIRHRF